MSEPLVDWFAPGDALELESGTLVMRHGRGRDWRPIKNSAALLGPFLRLHRGTDEAVLAYARRWGLLGLCSHGLPAEHHDRGLVMLAPPHGYWGSLGDHERRLMGPERIEWWRYWSSQADAVLAVAAPVKRELVTDSVAGYLEAWSVLERPMPWHPPAEAIELANSIRESVRSRLLRISGLDDPTVHPLYEVFRMDELKRQVADMLTSWLRLAGVALTIEWHGEVPMYSRPTHGLFGAIGKELLRAIQDSNAGWEVCSRCGEMSRSGGGAEAARSSAAGAVRPKPRHATDGAGSPRIPKGRAARNASGPPGLALDGWEHEPLHQRPRQVTLLAASSSTSSVDPNADRKEWAEPCSWHLVRIEGDRVRVRTHEAAYPPEDGTARAESRWTDSGHDFASTLCAGRTTRPRSLWSSRYALDRARPPRSRFHDLRYAASTPVHAQGFTREDVKDLLGHSSIVLTSNTYGRVLEQRQRQVAMGMDAVLGG
jgi:hypothetical protein